MKTKAALMTSKGAAAISCISLVGENGSEILTRLTTTASGEKIALKKGRLVLAEIIDSQKIIDQVVIACEDENRFTINCHGNPILVETIMELLKKNSVELISPKQMLFLEARLKYKDNFIAAESASEHVFSKTIEGSKLILNQKESGLSKVAHNWLTYKSSEEILSQCKDVLANTKIAKLIIAGANVIIAGTPNSGKSTLLNQICGKQKAIVADIAGTTRDWISATAPIESLVLEIFDTAGLDESLAAKTKLDKVSQEITFELLKKANLVLYVIDAENPEPVNIESLRNSLPEDAATIAIFNKIDLAQNAPSKASGFDAQLAISARDGKNIGELIALIRDSLKVSDFELDSPICFTQRQELIAEEMLDCGGDFAKIISLVDELISPK